MRFAEFHPGNYITKKRILSIAQDGFNATEEDCGSIIQSEYRERKAYLVFFGRGFPLWLPVSWRIFPDQAFLKPGVDLSQVRNAYVLKFENNILEIKRAVKLAPRVADELKKRHYLRKAIFQRGIICY